jgi:hypothetical protein
MTQSEKVKMVGRIIKKQMNLIGGMTNEQCIVLAHQIIVALERDATKVEVKPNNE